MARVGAPSVGAALPLVAFVNPAPLPEGLNRPNESHYQLSCLLHRAKVDETIILHLVAKVGLESISDFANFWSVEEAEAKIPAMVDDAGMMGQPVQVARLRSAWQLARAELSKAMESLSTAQSPSSSADLDDPLDEAAEKQRAETFSKAYDGLTFESDSMPLARLIGRLYRELTSPKRSLTTIPLKRMRTEGDIAGMTVKRHVTVQLGEGLQVRKEQGDSDLQKVPDLNLHQGNLLQLIKAVRVLCNAWALCGAHFVDHPTEKQPDGVTPKKVRNIHLSQAQRYHDFVFQKAMEFGPHKRGVVDWLEDRDRKTRNEARTLYANGLPWGECLIECIQNRSRLIWELSNVGVTDKLSLVRKPRQEDVMDDDDTDNDYPRSSGGASKGKGKRSRSAGAQRPDHPKKQKGGKTSKFEQKTSKDKDLACPSFNSLTGCTKKEANCPDGLKHVCSKCGFHGHSAVNCRRG